MLEIFKGSFKEFEINIKKNKKNFSKAHYAVALRSGLFLWKKQNKRA